ncbi:hypothetical protein QTP88_006947 [Uroleucon formosanum]
MRVNAVPYYENRQTKQNILIAKHILDAFISKLRSVSVSLIRCSRMPRTTSLFPSRLRVYINELGEDNIFTTFVDGKEYSLARFSLSRTCELHSDCIQTYEVFLRFELFTSPDVLLHHSEKFNFMSCDDDTSVTSYHQQQVTRRDGIHVMKMVPDDIKLKCFTEITKK